ncbi:B2 protein-like [Wolffia australiana]
MENEFWQFSDQLRVETSASFANLSIGDSIWADPVFARDRTEVRRNVDRDNGPPAMGAGQMLAKPKFQQQQQVAKPGLLDLHGSKLAFGNNFFSRDVGGLINKDLGAVANGIGQRSRRNNDNNDAGKGKVAVGGKKGEGNKSDKNNNDKTAVDKRFKTLPASEALPRNEAIGGYIFVCNNDTMEENLRRQLFGLPSRYRDSVRAITPGLPLFLYNYTTHQLHGVFEAASFGGTNIDPTAWEDKKSQGESRFPAQVRVLTRKVCEPLEEDAFRPLLHHYDGPKFRLELSVPEALAVLDIFEEKSA